MVRGHPITIEKGHVYLHISLGAFLQMDPKSKIEIKELINTFSRKVYFSIYQRQCCKQRGTQVRREIDL